MEDVTYIGDLVRVELADGREITVERTPFGVCDGLGIVCAETRQELRAGRIYSRPQGAKRPMRRFFYRRDRGPGGTLWVHDSPGASVVLGFEYGDPPVPWVESRGARRCNRPGDYVCGS